MSHENIRKLKAIVTREREPWSVCVAQVDPDGLGSAFGEVEIFHALGVEAAVYYGGEFDDPQNRHIRTLFRLDKKIRRSVDLPKSGPVSLVDSCKIADARFGIAIDPRRIKKITDHHLPDSRLVRPWRFIQICHAGAASTLIWEQGKALGVRFSPWTSALIALGIHSDTGKLRSRSTTGADRFAFAEAADRADQKLLAAGHGYPLPARYFSLAAETYDGWHQVGPAVLSHPNRRMRTVESGFVSRYADRLLQLNSAEVAVVWCLTESRIRASIRAKDPAFKLNAFIDYVFGKGFGGSKHGSGGALVPLARLRLPHSKFDDEIITRLDHHYRNRIANYFKRAH